MKNLIVLILLTISISSNGQKKDEKLIKATFKNYKQAILSENGEEAIKWVDQKTLDYYDKMLISAILDDSAKVAKANILDKITILTVRHRIPKDEVFEMDGNAFFIYAIDNGMIGKNSVMTLELGEIKIENTFATGQVVANGQAAPIYFNFYKEEEGWKLDLTSIFPVSIMGLNKIIAESGITEAEWLFTMLEMTGSKPNADLWVPLRK